MKLSGYRLVGRQNAPKGFKKQNILLSLVLDSNDSFTLLGKYNLKDIPYESKPNAKGEKYHNLYVSPTLNKFMLGDDLNNFKQFVYFDFIHFGTDVHCENPKLIITDEELQKKLYLDWKKLKTASHHSECIIDNSDSNCELLDFLKFKVCSIIR
ncbi:MAG: hypothetical protein CL832_07195 [Crocinitomicaceae bacterium]|nr:hypothetical protein [Crocinitomicaceae bacterium]|tara:strand:+ start:8067 stop:8528 length:462 start_codon:yes stop_codon:yes gene_type:complete